MEEEWGKVRWFEEQGRMGGGYDWFEKVKKTRGKIGFREEKEHAKNRKE